MNILKRTTVALLFSALCVPLLAYIELVRRFPSRSSTDHAPASRFGLVAADTNSLPVRVGGIDIIFVHGLGSNPDTTWRAKYSTNISEAPAKSQPRNKRYACWITDFLPYDIPSSFPGDIRLFFYNYDSYWANDAVDTRLMKLGNEFLGHIKRRIPKSDIERRRHLIFVAHSYGGLVVKQALILARQESSHIVDDTKAVVFLGTPHRGSSFSALANLVANAMRLFDSNQAIVANLAYDSKELLDLHSQFSKIVGDDLKIFNFHEERKVKVLPLPFFPWKQWCVTEQSATFHGKNVQNFGLGVDHYGLNKFSLKNAPYQIILSTLIEVTEPILSMAVQNTTPSPQEVKRHYLVSIKTVPKYTQRQELWAEMDRKLHIRHENSSIPYAVALHGLAGTGKSQLALRYAEANKERYNPILWIDARDSETLLSSFRRCARDLGISGGGSQDRMTALENDYDIQTMLRWLYDRVEADGEWLVIVDNADDFSWGIKKVIPRGPQGKVIITSRDNWSPKLIDEGCEQVTVDTMSPTEGRLALLQHLLTDKGVDFSSNNIQQGCDDLAQKLGYLAFAIDLAGAYISQNSETPEKGLMEYLKDYDRNCEHLMTLPDFKGLSPTEQTAWAAWDTTLEKVNRDYADLKPGLLLKFLAHFKSATVPGELFSLASLGILAIESDLGEAEFTEIREFITVFDGTWDSFRYRRALSVLLRYNLVKKVYERFPGVTMHGLVKRWAIKSDQSRPWRCWHTIFMWAASVQMKLDLEKYDIEDRLQISRYLADFDVTCCETTVDTEWRKILLWKALAGVLGVRGLDTKFEQIVMSLVEASQIKLGQDHPLTLEHMDMLAASYEYQRRNDEAEQLLVYLMETRKATVGEDHPDTLYSMVNVAIIYLYQGIMNRRSLFVDAERLSRQVMEIRKKTIGEYHTDTLWAMEQLARALHALGRLDESEKLFVSLMELTKKNPGNYNFNLRRVGLRLALVLQSQGRADEGKKLFQKARDGDF